MKKSLTSLCANKKKSKIATQCHKRKKPITTAKIMIYTALQLK